MIRTKPVTSWAVVAAATVAIGGTAFWLWPSQGLPGQIGAKDKSSWLTWFSADVSASRPLSTSSPTEGSNTSAVRSPDVLLEVLYKGSFEGTQPRGQWCARRGEPLVPCSGLRDRFEYYINGLGEITAPEVRALVSHMATQEVGAELAEKIMAIYDAYWQVRNYEYRARVDMSDTSSWLPALQEAQSVRRQFLGEAWTNAFFQEEDNAFVATHRRIESGLPPEPSPRDPVPAMAPGKDPEALRAARIERYGLEATLRLEQLDQAQARFDRDVASARAEWKRLQAQQQLSDADRQTQLQQFVAQRFDARDHRRAFNLAQLPADQ